jgi:two-component sensor histidine kinase
VVDAALEPFQRDRFTLEGPGAWLNPSISLQVTLAMHELATNAVKYGALRNTTGRVRLTWEKLDAERLKLCWREPDGPRVTTPKSKGFGSILIEHTFEGARFEYATQGITCTFEIPL